MALDFTVGNWVIAKDLSIPNVYYFGPITESNTVTGYCLVDFQNGPYGVRYSTNNNFAYYLDNHHMEYTYIFWTGNPFPDDVQLDPFCSGNLWALAVVDFEGPWNFPDYTTLSYIPQYWS